MSSKHIVYQDFTTTRGDREQQAGHKSLAICFTGLSGSGKSTIANALEQFFNKNDIRTYTLDGDNIRHGLNKDLGFATKDRNENIRRIGEVAKLFVDAGTLVITSFIMPLKEQRDALRKNIGDKDYIEVFVNTALEVCEQRDIKGLYKKARAGEIQNFTGISAVYEAPVNPDVLIDTAQTSVEDAVYKIYNHIQSRLQLNRDE